MEKKYNIEGMSCMHCVKHVTDALKELSGVKSVDVSLDTGIATVSFGANAPDDKAVADAINEVGYKVI